MAEFKFNDGEFYDIKIPKKHDQTAIYVSVELSCDDSAVKFAGHSIVNFDGDARILSVQFLDEKIGYPEACFDKRLVVIVDVSKIKVVKKDIKDVKFDTNCKLRVEAGDTILEELVLDDSTNPEFNSVFIYLITFKK